MERLSRGIALEQITAVTKISKRHLQALEQEHFDLLPGGILSKGIVRGYANAIGLDQDVWTERFLRASGTATSTTEDETDNWTAFAANVGKARILRHDSAEARIRWAGALALLVLVLLAGFFSVRYYGVRSGWWPTLIPGGSLHAWVHSLHQSLRELLSR